MQFLVQSVNTTANPLHTLSSNLFNQSNNRHEVLQRALSLKLKCNGINNHPSSTQKLFLSLQVNTLLKSNLRSNSTLQVSQVTQTVLSVNTTDNPLHTLSNNLFTQSNNRHEVLQRALSPKLRYNGVNNHPSSMQKLFLSLQVNTSFCLLYTSPSPRDS